MTDWQSKIQDLKDKSLSIHIEKNGSTIFESYDPMLKPLFICLSERRDALKDAVVVDKIVGRAAALLCALGGVKTVITPLASETARQVLEPANIELYAERTIPYIVNRDNTGMCPMEKMANDCTTPQEFFDKLTEVIKV